VLGGKWPSVRSKNLLCLPAEKLWPEPAGDGVALIAEHDLMVASLVAPESD
jgi:putative hemolysin